MPPGLPQTLLRALAGLLLAGILLLVGYGSLVKQRWPADVDFILVRWPFWVIVIVGVPLLALRLALWHRRRRQRPLPSSPPAP